MIVPMKIGDYLGPSGTRVVLIAMFMTMTIATRVFVGVVMRIAAGDRRDRKCRGFRRRRDPIAQRGYTSLQRDEIGLGLMLDNHGSGSHRYGHVVDSRRPAGGLVDLGGTARAIHAFDAETGFDGMCHGG
jgi:hypothetical protein